MRTALAGIVGKTNGILQGIVFEQQSPRLQMETEALVLPGLFPKYRPSAFFQASLAPPHCPDLRGLPDATVAQAQAEAGRAAGSCLLGSSLPLSELRPGHQDSVHDTCGQREPS